MKTIKVEDLKPGMSFTKPVFIDRNNVFVSENYKIREADIMRLRRWGIREVFTYGDVIEEDRKEESSVSSSDVKTEYIVEKHIEDVKNIPDFFLTLDNLEDLVGKISDYLTSEERVVPANLVNDLRKKIENLVDILTNAKNVILAVPYRNFPKDHPFYLYAHSVLATVYALVLGHALSFPKHKLIELGIGTICMDLGMLRLPRRIIEKEGSLTDEEFKIIKAHTIIGYKFAFESMKLKNNIAVVALQHHEAFDGTGYPKRLRGKDISEYARIAAIVDNFSSLCEERAYRDKMTEYNAMKELLSLGMAKFDPLFLRAFLLRMSMYPVGSLVKLGDGRIALVISPNKDKPLRPNIRIIVNQNGEVPKDVEVIDLSRNVDVYISAMLKPSELGFNLLDVL